MSSVTEKGQVTIPKQIREALGIRPGDELKFDIDGDSIRVMKEKSSNEFEKWKGALDTDKTVDEMMEEMRG